MTVQRNGVDDYEVIAQETISLVKNIPNHDDEGDLSSGVNDRECTSIYVTGTAANPVIYASSSDPRIGGPSGDKGLDTNSGVITKLTWNGSSWDILDIVRGLPRSEENHGPHGLEYAVINSVPHLLLSQGGHTNAGSPSTNFAWLNEYALSAAILAINLNEIESLPVKTDNSSGRKYVYDIPTLDDPTRPNQNGIIDPNDPAYNGIDLNDPWGGNDGLNQGKYDPTSPVKILSPGYRNSYDLVVTESGALYVTDNGANQGWGGYPENEGLTGTVNNNYRLKEPGTNPVSLDANEPSIDNADHLTLVTQNLQTYQFGSFYGGHPNPIRANPSGAGLFTKGDHSSDPNDSNNNTYVDDWFRTQVLPTNDPDFESKSLPVDWPPYPVNSANPIEGDFRGPTLDNPDGPEDDNVLIWKTNTNGIDEYTASNFGGAMKGDLIAGRNGGGNLHRIKLNSDGTVLSYEEDWVSGIGGNALGITCNGDNDIFPGTIWVASFNGEIHVFEPLNPSACILPGEQGYDPSADNDGDGYTNQDEIDNGTDICFAASKPNDFDGDKISDLNDLDDDGDGLNDQNDPFQLGQPFDLPVNNELFSDQLDLLGYLGLGLTGVMNNGDPNPNYLNFIDNSSESSTDVDDIYGGAIGGVTIFQTEGDALTNDQEKAFQFGVNVNSTTDTFIVSGGMVAPFHTHSNTESQGLFIGDGFQDDYLKIVLSGSNIFLAGENNGNSINNLPTTTVSGSFTTLDLYFTVDPVNGKVQASYSIDKAQKVNVGGPISLFGSLLDAVQKASQPLAVGIIGTADTKDGFAANWDFISVNPKTVTANENVIFRVNAGGPTIPAIDGGLDWISDVNASLANQNFTVNTGNVYPVPADQWASGVSSDIKNRTPFSIFNTDRFDFGDGEEMKYTFNVGQPGSYKVRLFLRDSYWGTAEPASRIFTVLVDGNSYANLIDIDLSGDVGFKNGAVYEVQIESDDANLDIEFIHYVNNPLVSGIEIIKIEEAVIEEIKVPIFRVNAGGPALPSLDTYAGWVSDIGASMNANKFTVNTGFISLGPATTWENGAPAEIVNTTPFDVFNSERFDFADGEELKYTFDVDNAGKYLVRLFLRDQYSGTANPGQRVFSIQVDGNNYADLNAIDLSADPGFAIAKVVEVEVITADDIITVDFIRSAQNPLICGIEILRVSAGNPITPTPSPDGWTLVSTNNDHIPRHECSFIQTGTNFYMLGGRESATTMERYNIYTKTWDQVASAPKPFNHFQAVEYEGLIWVICAFQNNAFPQEVPADYIHVYDPVKDIWIQGPEIPAGRKRGGAGVVVFNDKFYIVGGNTIGHDGGYVAWFDVYDPVNQTWTSLDDAPNARDHFQSSIIGNKLYIAGGRLSGGPGGVFAPMLAEVDVYDFNTQTWTTLPAEQNLPTPRAGTSTVTYKNEVVVMGGEGNGQAFSTVEAYNPVQSSWRSLPDMNFPRHGTQAIVSGDGIFITSGSPNLGGGNQTNMESYGSSTPVGATNIASTLTHPESVEIAPGETMDIEIGTVNGNVGVYITKLSITGANADDFTLEYSLVDGFLLPTGSTLDLPVTLDPTASAGASGLLVIEYGNNETIQIGLNNTAVPCTGTDIPTASIATTDETSNGANDGIIVFTFADDAVNGGSRTTLEFSIDGGQSYPYSVSDNAVSFTISNLSPNTYSLWVRWENGECPQSLGSITIGAGGEYSEIESFILVSAESDLALTTIENGSTINLFEYPNPLNIAADVGSNTPFVVKSVKIELVGPINLSRTEGVAPYALGGDSNGNYSPITFPTGDYILQATAYSQGGAKGTAGTTKIVSFTIIDNENDPCANINPTVSLGSDIQLSCSQANTTLTANASENGTYTWTGPNGFSGSGSSVVVSDEGTYSVLFATNEGCQATDQITVSRVGYTPTVSLPANVSLDCSSGNAAVNVTISSYSQLSWTGPNGFSSTTEDIVVSTAGTYILQIENAEGCQKTYSVEVGSCVQACTVSRVEKLILVNADTDQDIMEITDGMTIYLGDIQSEIAIRAQEENCTFTVNSITLDLTGEEDFYREESKAPWALFGDSNGNFSPWDAEVGSYNLKATPYSEKKAKGTVGEIKEVNFVVSNGNAPAVDPNPTPITNQPPVITLTSDISTNNVQEGDDITLTANASDSDGMVTSVNFFNGNNLIGNKTSSPFELTISSLSPGTYSFSAVATDDDGAQTTSNTISFAILDQVAGCDAIFEEENGLVVMEVERVPTQGDWVFESSLADFTGNGYIRWDGSNYFSSPGNGLLEYTIKINTPGTYRFNWRSFITTGGDPKEHNDSWVRFPDASDFYGQNASGIVYPKGSGKTPLVTGAGSDGWFKAFMNNLDEWTWNAWSGDENAHLIFVDFDFPGVYTMQISGRSNGHAIDRAILYDVSKISGTNAEKVTNGETLCNDPAPQQSFQNLNDGLSDFEVLLAPNRTFDRTNLMLKGIELGEVSAEIIDIRGRIVLEVTDYKDAYEHTIPVIVSGLSEGIYWVRVNLSTHSEVLKLLIE
ncbi:MAG: kelch repeat-containing protein [Bacteroidota bacterium]